MEESDKCIIYHLKNYCTNTANILRIIRSSYLDELQIRSFMKKFYRAMIFHFYIFDQTQYFEAPIIQLTDGLERFCRLFALGKRTVSGLVLGSDSELVLDVRTQTRHHVLSSGYSVRGLHPFEGAHGSVFDDVVRDGGAAVDGGGGPGQLG